MGDAAVITLACVTLLWVTYSAWLGRRSVTPSLTFLVAGLLVAWLPGDRVQVHPSSHTLQLLAEYALALLLFTDASRVSFAWLRSRALVPGRLLLIALPLSIALGAAVALALPLHASAWVAALMGAILAPTDAALSATILADERVPATIRSTLNVESGLNDGLATPFVLFFLSAAAATTEHQSLSAAVREAVRALVLGVGAGLAVGGLGAWLLVLAGRRGWLDRGAGPLGVLALAVLAYAGADQVTGNGFVAAFVAGLAFGNVLRRSQSSEVELAEGLGDLLAYAVWFAFGAALVAAFWRQVSVAMLMYATLSLTVVRMLPVAVALVGARWSRRDVLVIGWLGPRGLASIVFGLLAFDTLGPESSDARLVIEVVGLTVLLSVVLHGLLAGPVARVYPAVPTAAPDRVGGRVVVPRSRHLLGWTQRSR